MPFDRESSTKRGYGYKWQKAREAFLSDPDNVLCRFCEEDGRVVVATVVDHIIPHKKDLKLFWNRRNWQPLCKSCHDGRKQAEEKAGKPQTKIGVDGWPE